jgi:hypothetical protein
MTPASTSRGVSPSGCHCIPSTYGGFEVSLVIKKNIVRIQGNFFTISSVSLPFVSLFLFRLFTTLASADRKTGGNVFSSVALDTDEMLTELLTSSQLELVGSEADVIIFLLDLPSMKLFLHLHYLPFLLNLIK